MGSSNTAGGVAKEENGMPDGGVDGGGSPAETPAFCKFSEGEKVLAYHGPRLYEAKVQKTEIRKDEWKYFVHYLGWSKSWDEWVVADRLLKFTEENIAKQKFLAKNQNLDKTSKSGRSTQSKPRSSNDVKVEKEDLRNQVSRGKKRKGQSGTEEKSSVRSAEKLAMLQFPPTLKKQLVDDWEFVTQLGKLVKLPRSPNVDDILKKYLEYRTKKDGMIAESVVEILKGIRCYFDKALPLMLLYKKERQQYQEAVHDSISPSSIYGAEHLLRLFVKLPELLSYVNMEEDASGKLQQKLLDLLKFLQKNQNLFFLSTYNGSKSMEKSED
ncbi:protein MRG1 [Phalaenopsis equestris]|uniref:protein MRG1 n=1 Tax=Phalaenopsis equestris TaxID=78828 RepID=UPI0009E2601E|nr:protein MRG1 [Phalaenopsis equestris]